MITQLMAEEYVRAQCGEYSFMCCIKREDMLKLLNMYDRLGRDAFFNVYKLSCACSVPEKTTPVVVVPPKEVPPKDVPIDVPVDRPEDKPVPVSTGCRCVLPPSESGVEALWSPTGARC